MELKSRIPIQEVLAESGSRLHIWITIWIQIQIFKKQISKKKIFLIFTFPYVTIMKI